MGGCPGVPVENVAITRLLRRLGHPAAPTVSWTRPPTPVAGAYGTLYINSATGAYEYIVNDAAVEALKTTQHDTFTFTVDDGHGGTDSQALDVTINGVNDKPTLSAISGMSYTDTSGDDTFSTQSGTLVGGDRDNDPISYHATGEALNNTQSGFDHAVAGT